MKNKKYVQYSYMKKGNILNNRTNYLSKSKFIRQLYKIKIAIRNLSYLNNYITQKKTFELNVRRTDELVYFNSWYINDTHSRHTAYIIEAAAKVVQRQNEKVKNKKLA